MMKKKDLQKIGTGLITCSMLLNGVVSFAADMPKDSTVPTNVLSDSVKPENSKVIKFKTVFKADDTLKFGETKIVQKGVDGERDSKDLTKVVKEPVDEIVHIGNKEVIAKDIDFNTVFTHNSKLKTDERKVTQKGVNGVETTVNTYSIDEKGKLVKPESKTEITKKSVDELIETGSKDIVEKDVEFNTVYKVNPKLKFKETKTVQEGKKGVQQTVKTYKEKDGKHTDTVETTTTKSKAVEKIVEIGNVDIKLKEIDFNTVYKPLTEFVKVESKANTKVENKAETKAEDKNKAKAEVKGEVNLDTEVVVGKDIVLEKKDESKPATTTKNIIELPQTIEVREKTNNKAETKAPERVAKTETKSETKKEAKKDEVKKPTMDVSKLKLAFKEEKVIQEGKKGSEEVKTTYEVNDKGELVNPKEEKELKENPVDKIVVVGNIETTKEDIDFKTVEVKNPDLKLGEKRVVRVGQKGIKELTKVYKIDEKTGQMTDKYELKEVVKAKAIDKVVEVGTKQVKKDDKKDNKNDDKKTTDKKDIKPTPKTGAMVLKGLASLASLGVGLVTFGIKRKK